MFWNSVVEGIGWVLGGFIGLLILAIVIVLLYSLWCWFKDNLDRG